MRKQSLWTSKTEAITPNIQTTLAGLQTRSEMVKIIADQKATIDSLMKQIATIRRRHDAAEAALVKYQVILERTITEQREAFLTCGQALKPSPSRREK